MLLIDCEINLILTWSANCVISSGTAPNQSTTFAITDTKRYVQLATLSTQDNAKPLKQLKSGFKRIINWNKFQSKVAIERQYHYLDYFVDPSFQGVNRLFVLSFEDKAVRTGQTRYFFQLQK